MNIYVFETEVWERPAFARLRDEGHTVHFVDRPLKPDEATEFADADVVSTFIYSRPTPAALDPLTHLRLIATRSTGVDHIPRNYCTKRGIAVCNVPGYGESTVAEHVFALLLTISHNMYAAVDRTRKGDFSLAGLRGFDLAGKTLGVIGTGAIGRHVIRIACGFEMNVLAYDVAPDPQLTRDYGCTYVQLEELLRQADIISLHVPSAAGTRHLIAAPQFELMKPGVVLINTARGDVVEIRALMAALASGKLAAAGLDVLPEEPTIREEAELLHRMFQRQHDLETLLADHVLLRLRNVYITPHSAFNTREAVERIIAITVENIRAFVSGQPQNVVFGGRP